MTIFSLPALHAGLTAPGEIPCAPCSADLGLIPEAGPTAALVVLGAALGAFALACRHRAFRRGTAALLLRDGPVEQGAGTPRPLSVVLWSTGLGLVFLTFRFLHHHGGLDLTILFQKEGLLETGSAGLYAIGGALMLSSARRQSSLSRIPDRRIIASVYVLLGAAFLLLTMEEVSWGQTLLEYRSPALIGELNAQGETNLHNILSTPLLDTVTRITAAALYFSFVRGVCAQATRPLRWPHYVLPHASLAGLAFLTFVAGLFLHLENFEFLLALAAAFYSYRAYRITAPSDTTAA